MDTMPLILWNQDQPFYMSFHFKCALKEEMTDDFSCIANDFNYTYEIKENK